MKNSRQKFTRSGLCLVQNPTSTWSRKCLAEEPVTNVEERKNCFGHKKNDIKLHFWFTLLNNCYLFNVPCREDFGTNQEDPKGELQQLRQKIGCSYRFVLM